ncbi:MULTISPECIES: cytidine deaminase [Priestia]|uniref:Cytidine deaminase n=5 Tax=Priestia TaxID=2800373 RepID=D5DUD8_PRIM1|nr:MULTISPECIES: cytidine deaminase [Priestia]AVX08799.1 cytidine deaminase [Bacillus sp. Y-01]KOP74939.1 cytidine deaminase [Bacillus sp. FJAT-21351]KQU11819.1 cytidine deaminase [Bacillus sp. Leaf75]MBK0005346.1 cytidine deaminase [Bacillus sp. S35]MBK0293694.1 cytidine deaminase [Bacillus sp. S34]MBU8852388.1 cytidine deaminase [Bacillus sp. FJAT-26377]MCF6796665.1 cytidine deaminase [Bacillus sp. ET1]MCJ7989419.1 cytidine deaminase [Priestia sp. OVS21]MCL9635100.1 cytidine deaminase [B
MEPKQLIDEAIAASKQAHVPYSHFHVGAALLTTDGKIYRGCNIENASYGLTNCAERTAIFKAVSEGDKQFSAIAVVGDTDGPISPCGACRQVLAEFCDDHTQIILANLKGDFVITNINEILPGYFSSKDLQK